MHTEPNSPLCEPGRSLRPALARVSSPNRLVNKTGNAHTLELPTEMDLCLSRAVCGLLLNDNAYEENDVDNGEVVDSPDDVVDDEAVERPVDR